LLDGLALAAEDAGVHLKDGFHAFIKLLARSIINSKNMPIFIEKVDR
jgi:hypothetical protein